MDKYTSSQISAIRKYTKTYMHVECNIAGAIALLDEAKLVLESEE